MDLRIGPPKTLCGSTIYDDSGEVVTSCTLDPEHNGTMHSGPIKFTVNYLLHSEHTVQGMIQWPDVGRQNGDRGSMATHMGG